MVYIIAMDMDNPWFLGLVAILGVIVLPLVALESCEREKSYHPHTALEWSSGATPDDTDPVEE